MKILIVSDTHGHERNLKKVIGRVGPVDEFIHLGDIEGHEDYIEALVDCPVHMVSGNNDFFSDLPREETFYLGKYQVMIFSLPSLCSGKIWKVIRILPKK